MALFTPIGVLSFPHLFEPRPPSPGAEPKYSVSLIFDEEAQQTKEYEALAAAIVKAAEEKWGGKVPSNVRWPIRDGSDKEGYEGYGAGRKFLNLSSKQKPGIVDGHLQSIITPSDVWAGQLARASVTVYAYDNVSRGVGVGLNNIQICKLDMPRIDGKQAADKEFGAVDMGDAPREGGQPVASQEFAGGGGSGQTLPF